MTYTLGGAVVQRARVQVPAWGLWWAEVEVQSAAALTGAVVLELGAVTWRGTVTSGGAADGRASYRIVGGAGGWGREVGAQSYASDAGVKLASVVSAVAAEAGETIADVPTARVGPHYVRTRGPASRVLSSLAPRAWYVDRDGVTRLGQRPSVPYAGAGVVTDRRPSVSALDVDTDDLTPLAPGVRVEGHGPASDVEHRYDGTRLVTTVYYATAVPRRAQAMMRLIDALDPRRIYRGVYEYRVVTQSGDRLALQPVRSSTGLPDLANVPVRPGMAGLRATYALGSLVLVAFVDADPGRPCVVAADAPDAAGWQPLALDLCGPVPLPAARVTDAVVAGPFAGAITAGSAVVRIG